MASVASRDAPSGDAAPSQIQLGSAFALRLAASRRGPTLPGRAIGELDTSSFSVVDGADLDSALAVTGVQAACTVTGAGVPVRTVDRPAGAAPATNVTVDDTPIGTGRHGGAVTSSESQAASGISEPVTVNDSVLHELQHG